MDKGVKIFISLEGKEKGIIDRIMVLPEDPRMENILVEAETGSPHAIHSIVWKLDARYNGNGLSLAEGTAPAAVGAVHFTINNSQRWWGSSLNLRLEVKLHGGFGENPPAQHFNITVVGINPERTLVENYLSDRILYALALKLTEAKLFDENGQVLSLDGGFGMFLMPVSNMSVLFNWKFQCDAAKQKMEQFRKYWSERTAQLRLENPKYKNLQDLNPEQVKRAALQSWRGGEYFVPVHKGWIFKKYVWEKNSDQAQTSFADSVLVNG